MRQTVTIIDFDAGNLLNVARAFEYCGYAVNIVDSPEAVGDAGHLVLPGVGAFADCVQGLRQRELDTAVIEHVRAGKPLLGICVGMQMLLDSSEEFGRTDGLGLIPGRVIPIPPQGKDGQPHKIPHVGWKEIQPFNNTWDNRLLTGVPDSTAVYFVHSFMADPSDKQDVLAVADYDGVAICAAIAYENVLGTQFHPEKSGEMGLRMIRQYMQH